MRWESTKHLSTFTFLVLCFSNYSKAHVWLNCASIDQSHHFSPSMRVSQALISSFHHFSPSMRVSQALISSFHHFSPSMRVSQALISSFHHFSPSMRVSQALISSFLLRSRKLLLIYSHWKKRHSADSVFVTHLTTQFFSQCLEVQRPHHSPRITLLRSFSLETCLLFRWERFSLCMQLVF